ncbi:MAG: DNA repair protein RadA [Lachnospiraceae bacterium]|jgi:DNA repair protein radA|nr:DNA repair protein RadA [Lachnospiraceae bacterium]MBF1001723.1 DNA repair protein RadA [Lachnospiraceae bacterium]MBF1003452.1 DNA repair protein RadA [Lachnospiraceae bacterium]MBF1007794.1 DNA repair protein RadA [Lachnospiraceae bacterium]MBF1012180.1 DNA repair protein RadA [Lachnospiraceae bacterium]
MTGKNKTVFFCRNCGYESAKWMGQCPSCKEWNSFVEEPVKGKGSRASTGSFSAGGNLQPKNQPLLLSEIKSGDGEERFDTHFKELNRVLGGGLVKGSLVLIGGDPGVGKSTLLLQSARFFSMDGRSVLYVSGEESARQIKLRADRIGVFTKELLFLAETNLSVIEETLLRVRPEIVVIDSIQTMFHEEISSAPGSVSQVRETTGMLLRIAKQENIAILIVGHVTKEGMVAGPKVLEHMVDTVLYFEGDRNASYKILRAVKNRFGSTNEIGVFEMRSEGLMEVENPSEFMLDGRPKDAGGSIVSCSMEGSRPIMIEIQALVCRTNFGYPRRQANGMDYNRVNLLMAVLEKRIGLQMSDCDAYVNLAGGMKLTEPAMDLGICLAIISSFRNRPVDPFLVAFGEVGLSGEVRAVSMANERVKEALKLGFTVCLLPKASMGRVQLKEEDRKKIKLIGVENVRQAMDLI